MSYAVESWWPGAKIHRGRLEKAQRFYVQSLTNDYLSPYPTLLERLSLPPIWLLAQIRRLTLLRDYVHGERFVPNGTLPPPPSKARRSQRTNHNYTIELHANKNAVSNSFFYSAVRIWNALPGNVPGLAKRDYAAFMLSPAFTTLCTKLNDSVHI